MPSTEDIKSAVGDDEDDDILDGASERGSGDLDLDDDDDLEVSVAGLPDVKSLLDQVADLREEAKGDHFLDLPIPGTRKLLWARFRAFPSSKTEKKMAEYRKVSERGGAFVLLSACDLLIDACEQLMVLPARFEGDPGNLGENLSPIDDAIPVAFDSRCADLFIKNPVERAAVKKARDVVLAMFPTEQAVIQMNIDVSAFLNDVTKDADEQLLQD